MQCKYKTPSSFSSFVLFFTLFTGESCMEKPLATLWRNYTQNCKPDVSMRVRICPSGLKATTRQHGLTEYWSHRITFCSAPRNYPKVFCWIYRHEGRKLKHELRCHAVLCTKDTVAESIAKTLQVNIVCVYVYFVGWVGYSPVIGARIATCCRGVRSLVTFFLLC